MKTNELEERIIDFAVSIVNIVDVQISILEMKKKY